MILNYIMQRVFRQYASFDQIGREQTRGSGLEFRSGVVTLDWYRFTVDDLMQRLSDLADVIRRLDDHPVHVNPHNIGLSVLAAGQSIWREAEIVDFLGCSAHPPWHSLHFPADRITESIACFAQLMRAATPAEDGKFWVSELQGGPTLYSAGRPSGVDRRSMTQWLWTCVGTGAEATVFWCFNQRSGGFEGGEWGLLGVDGEASPRLLASQAVSEQIRRASNDLDQARHPDCRVAIVIDEASEMLALIDGCSDDFADWRNRQAYMQGVCGAWMWAHDMGHEVTFLHHHDLISSPRPTLI